MTITRLLLVCTVIVVINITAWCQEESPPQVQSDSRMAQQITIATYNVENLLDEHDDPYTFDEVTPPKPRQATQRIAKLIRHINPDVLVLQEVENEGLLRSVARRYLKDMNYDHVVVMPSNSRHGHNLGVISRWPIESMTSHRFTKLPTKDSNTPPRFARDLLLIKLSIKPNQTLYLYTTHFKARRDREGDPLSTKWRVAEATATRRIIQEQVLDNYTNAWVVLAGDLNATPTSPAMNVLLNPGPDRQVILHDPHTELSSSQRVTYRRKNQRTTVDYILISSALMNRVMPGTARVFSDKKWRTGSDHVPVVLTLNLGS